MHVKVTLRLLNGPMRPMGLLFIFFPKYPSHTCIWYCIKQWHHKYTCMSYTIAETSTLIKFKQKNPELFIVDTCLIWFQGWWKWLFCSIIMYHQMMSNGCALTLINRHVRDGIDIVVCNTWRAENLCTCSPRRACTRSERDSDTCRIRSDSPSRPHRTRHSRCYRETGKTWTGTVIAKHGKRRSTSR